MPSYLKTGYGLSDALPSIFPSPIKANRIPTTADKGYQIGQVWVYSSVNQIYVLTSIVNNLATWQLLSVVGGAGIFSSLVVTGPSTLTGTTLINVSGAADTVIGGVVNTGSVSIGNVNSTDVTILAPLVQIDSTALGEIKIGDSVTSGQIEIAISLTDGGLVICNQLTTGQVLFGNPAGTGDVNFYSESMQLAAASTGRLYLNASGQIQVAFISDIVASPAATAVINARNGYATFTGFTTAAGASQVFTITNSKAVIASAILVSANNLGANDAQMTVTRVFPGAGTFDVTLTNNGAAALNGDINITFWVMD